MSENKICVYAICKNEGKFVDAWVESMKEADLIVVLDTGSTDDTLERFKKYDFVKVEQKIFDPFRFDDARNAALELIPPEYNIRASVDLDEIFEPGWAQIIRDNWVEGIHERASYRYAWSHLENGEPGRIFRYNKVHSKNWIWKYPVHELLFNPTTNTNLYDYNQLLDLFDSKIFLHHYPDKTKSRSSYLPLLEIRASEDENDYYGLIYLAHEYYYRGRYEDSIKTLNKVLEKFSNRCVTIEKASCYLFMGDSFVALKGIENNYKAITCYNKAIDIDPTYRESYINIAKVYIELKKYDIAISYLNDALKNTHRHYTWLERDKSWTYELWDLLSFAEFYSGKKALSLAHAYKAYSYDNTNKRLKDNIDAILKNSKDLELI